MVGMGNFLKMGDGLLGKRGIYLSPKIAKTHSMKIKLNSWLIKLMRMSNFHYLQNYSFRRSGVKHSFFKSSS